MFDLCTYFNKQVKIYDRIKEDLHYFRLKLNRCPETLDDMIKTINNTENDDNGKNMGTYNYASSSKDAGNHTKYDVDTYKKWGNTPLDPKPIDGSWNDNVVQNLAFGLAGYYEPYKKGSHWYDLDKVDRDAQNHYTEVCEAIGIKYDKLLKNIFSDACY